MTTTNSANTAPSNPDEAIQKTLAEDAKRRDEQRNSFEYGFHPKAAIFPLMEDDELDELGKNIVANGLLEPITIKDKMIVDGRNRYRACRRMDHKFSEMDFVELPSDVDLLSFVISKNIVRRHLTAEQKREVIAILLRENPNASSRAIAGLARVSHHTVEAVREATGQSAQSKPEEAEQPAQKRTGRDGRRRRAPAKKRGPSPKQQADQIASFKEDWEALDSWQKHSFVKANKAELLELIENVEAEEEEATLEEGEEAKAEVEVEAVQ